MCASTKSWSTSRVTTWSNRSLQEGSGFWTCSVLIWNLSKLEGFSRPSLSHSARLPKTEIVKVIQIEVTGFIQVTCIWEHINMQLPEPKQNWVFYKTKRREGYRTMVLSQLQFSLFVNAAQLAVRIVSAYHNSLRIVVAISFWLLSEQLFWKLSL